MQGLKEKEQEEIKKSEVIKESVKKQKSFTIMGITIWRLLAYFIIYSIAGYIIETLFGLLTKGVLESRQSFLYGPFCGIYGVGAVIMIPLLQRFKKNNYTLFCGGFFIGSVVEYVISLIGEMVFHIKWWDYSEMAFNIDGRICIAFSFFWGILAIYLMAHINPKIDKLIDTIKDKFSIKWLKTGLVVAIVLLFLDFAVTSFALKMFFTRLIHQYDLQLQSYEYVFECEELYKNEEVKNFTMKYFSDEKMLKTFPNIKLTKADGKIIWISDILKDIQPYYIRVFTPSIGK